MADVKLGFVGEWILLLGLFGTFIFIVIYKNKKSVKEESKKGK